MLIYTGIATFLNAGWALLLLPFALVGIRRHVIEREEPYLERTFGTAYVAYTRRVRRWI
jgi:protein-S-isoprenylcysteine O-methyltransferase Ste14